MKQLFSTLLTVAIILSGTALIERFYEPSSEFATAYQIHFPGEITDHRLLDLTPSQRDRLLLLLNEGTENEISNVAGIASVRSESIRKARPFRELKEVQQAEGIGPRIFTNIIAHADSAF